MEELNGWLMTNGHGEEVFRENDEGAREVLTRLLRENKNSWNGVYCYRVNGAMTHADLNEFILGDTKDTVRFQFYGTPRFRDMGGTADCVLPVNMPQNVMEEYRLVDPYICATYARNVYGDFSERPALTLMDSGSPVYDFHLTEDERALTMNRIVEQNAREDLIEFLQARV